MPCDQLKEEYKAQILYHVNLYRTRFQCGLNLHIHKFILNTNKRCLVFVMSNFVLNIMFSSMLSNFELCQQRRARLLPCLRMRDF
jgi:hypothetical protein